MRYILDDSGYIEEVTFGAMIECNNKGCTEYTGTIPDGYTSLVEWSDNANIRAYKIVDGNLTFDADRDAELQAEWESQTEPTIPTSIGISTTTLKSGFSTTATTVDFTGYIGVYIRVLPATDSGFVPLFIPANLISTTARSYQGADESNWVSLSLQKSGTNIIITGKGRSATSGTYVVYGVKLTLS